MIVMKFGGAAFPDANGIFNVCKILDAYRENNEIVVVVSAMESVTDKLFEIVEYIKNKEIENALSILDLIRSNHLAAVDIINSQKDGVLVRIELIKLFSRLEYFIKGLAKKRITPARIDYITSFGERFNVMLVAEALKQSGIRACPVDAVNLLATTHEFGNAVPLGREHQHYLDIILYPLIENGIIPVVTGYIGYSQDGCTTTFARGGSDLSASYLANFLDADAVYLWKDVQGFYSTDPKKNEDAELFTVLSYDKAEQLAKRGANIIYYKALYPVREKSIPIYIKSYVDPSSEGTIIGQIT